jgi:hypothetical protein
MAVPLTLDEFRTPRPVAGWRVLLTTFCMALAAWGLGFYSLSVYVQYLAASGRFPLRCCRRPPPSTSWSARPRCMRWSTPRRASAAARWWWPACC